MLFIVCNFLLSGNHVRKMSLQEFVREWIARINCHDWKLQIRKEIKEAESEKEKSDLRTNQYGGCLSLLKNPIDTRPDGLEL